MPVKAATIPADIATQLLRLPDVRRISLARMARIFDCGQPARWLYLLEHGLIKLSLKNERGREIVLSLAGTGQLFGERAISERGRYDMIAETVEPSTIVRIPRAGFVAFCRQRPDMWARVCDAFLDRQRALVGRIELLFLHDVEQRIVRTLTELAGVYSSEGEIPLSQQDLAGLIGATRETTSATLNLLERRGMVRLGRRRMALPGAPVRRASDSQTPRVRPLARARRDAF